VRKLTFGMNLSLDGYIAAPGDDIGWSVPSEDGGPMDIGGATLAAAAMRAGLIDEYVLATAPVLVGSGTPFFTALDNWVNLNLVETRAFPDGVVLTRYETKR
jgi:dihydrofolate reductase